jgi:hypothetical protein
MSLVWASRGRSWGFRFLRDGGLRDPLPHYGTAFAHVGDEPEICCRDGKSVALRFPDPLDRRDAAGRVILHEFVLSGPLADGINSPEDGRRLVWPLVAQQFADVWDLPRPPSACATGAPDAHPKA